MIVGGRGVKKKWLTITSRRPWWCAIQGDSINSSFWLFLPQLDAWSQSD